MNYKVCKKAKNGRCIQLVKGKCKLGYDPENETCLDSRSGFVKANARCPTCGSSRMIKSSLGYGVSKKRTIVGPFENFHKMFRCEDCGYKW